MLRETNFVIVNEIKVYDSKCTAIDHLLRLMWTTDLRDEREYQQVNGTSGDIYLCSYK